MITTRADAIRHIVEAVKVWRELHNAANYGGNETAVCWTDDDVMVGEVTWEDIAILSDAYAEAQLIIATHGAVNPQTTCAVCSTDLLEEGEGVNNVCDRCCRVAREDIG